MLSLSVCSRSVLCKRLVFDDLSRARTSHHQSKKQKMIWGDHFFVDDNNNRRLFFVVLVFLWACYGIIFTLAEGIVFSKDRLGYVCPICAACRKFNTSNQPRLQESNQTAKERSCSYGCWQGDTLSTIFINNGPVGVLAAVLQLDWLY